MSAASTRSTSASVLSAFQFDAALLQDLDLVFGRAARAQPVVADVVQRLFTDRLVLEPARITVLALAGQSAEVYDLIESQPDVDHLDAAGVAVAPGADAQILGNREPLAVEVGQDEDLRAGRPEGVDQLQLGLDVLPFVAHDREVMLHVDLERAQQVGDAAFLDDQHTAEAMAGAARLHLPVRRLDAERADLGAVRPAPAVGRDFGGPEPDSAVRVRLDQLAAGLIEHPPAGG
jgi:hypothetical protein